MPKIINPLNRLSIFASHLSDPRASISPSTFRLSTFGLLFIFSFFILQCGLDVEDPIPPSPPVWVQKSLPEEWPERGIDAHESGGIYLEWEASISMDVVAYHIYRASKFGVSPAMSDYELIASLGVDGLAHFDYTDNNTIPGQIYFYKIRSENIASSISGFSDSTSYSILQQISTEWMSPHSLNDTLAQDRISWHGYYLDIVENYCLTLMTIENELIVRILVQSKDYLSHEEYWSIPDDRILVSGSFYKWRIDGGANYVGGIETFGSESPWAYFLYVGS